MAQGSWTQTFPSISEHTKAQGSQVNTRVAGLGSNYDMLPAPHDDGKKGFFEPCYVGDASELGHAPNVTDIRNSALTHGVESGVADAYVVTMAIASTAYTAGMKVSFVATNANTGASTVNIDSLGIVSMLVATDIELGSQYLRTGDIVEITYTGSFFQVTSVSSYSAERAEISASESAASAASAAASETNAAASELSASGSATTATNASLASASSANFIGKWEDQTGAHVVPTSVWHDDVTWNLVSNVADIALSEPGTTSDWVQIGTTTREGELFMWPFDSPPSYGLVCNGGTHDYDDYPKLGALLGGSPGGTFTTPVISTFMKASNGTDTLTTEAESVGTHGHTADAVASHGHSISVSAVGNHTHSIGAYGYSSFASGSYTAANDVASQTGSSGGHGHSASAGSGGGHTPTIQDHTGTNQPACTLVNICIRIE